MEEIKQEIEKIQGQIKEAKRNEATYEGRLQEARKRLKDELGFDSIEKAKKELVNMKAGLEKLTGEVQTQFSKLKEDFTW
jgi:hypothetical protein